MADVSVLKEVSNGEKVPVTNGAVPNEEEDDEDDDDHAAENGDSAVADGAKKKKKKRNRKKKAPISGDQPPEIPSVVNGVGKTQSAGSAGVKPLAPGPVVKPAVEIRGLASQGSSEFPHPKDQSYPPRKPVHEIYKTGKFPPGEEVPHGRPRGDSTDSRRISSTDAKVRLFF